MGSLIRAQVSEAAKHDRMTLMEEKVEWLGPRKLAGGHTLHGVCHQSLLLKWKL